MKKAKRLLGLSLGAALAVTSASLNTFADELTADEYVYGTMKIPYSKFYEAELEGADNFNDLDAVSSATAKHSLETGKGQMLEGVWSEAVSDAGTNKAGSEIASKLYGVVYPVAVKRADLKAMGADNYGFEETEKPETYKVVTVDEGKVSFSSVQDDTPESVTGSISFNYSSPWGDYVAAVDGKPQNGTVIYGILLKTADGELHALRHEQNIWRNGEIAWSSGIKTTEPHGNYLESEGFESLMGNKITEVDYITPTGYVIVNVGEVYVPVKFDGGISVADTPVSAGSAEIIRNNIPEDFEAEYSVTGLEAQFDGDSFTFSSARPGAYTLTAKDGKNKYAELTASFKLTTSEMPAAYSDKDGAVIASEGHSHEELAAFLNNITEVSVNGTSYSASGKRAVKIIGADGMIDDNASPFSDNAESYELSVTAAGFDNKLEFTYHKFVYGRMNIPYDKFYSAEAENIENFDDLDAVSSATVAKTKMNGKGQLFEGTYNNSGEEDSDTIGKIYGVNYPVAVSRSALKAFEEDAFTPSEEKPEAYKLVLLKDGEISFEKVNDAEPENIEASPKTETDTKRGDYMLTVSEASGFGVIYGVIIKTDDGKYYAMRHERNIWRNELAWSVGFLTDDGKGNALEYENMLATNGATVTEIIYITDKGYITVSTDTYLPKKFCKYNEPPVHVENADINDGKTTFTEDEFPNDYRKEYSVSGLDAHIRSGEIEFENAAPGAYNLTVTDAEGVYESVSAEFTLFTNDIPAVFDSKAVRLVAAEGFTDEQLAAYLKNITSVTVDGKEYAASGKKAAKIIKEDGSLDTVSDVFAESESFEITVKSAGYANDLSFTYRVNGEENKEQYTITFDTDGGSEIAPITQEAGTKVVPPTAPVKTGYTFIGWKPEIPETMPPKNITLKALWKRDLSDTPKTGVSQPSNTGVSSVSGGSSVTGAGSSGNAPAATPSDGKTNDTSPTVTAVNGDTPAPTPPSTDGAAAPSDNPSTGSEDPFSAFMFIAAAGLAAVDLINKKALKEKPCDDD